MGLVMCALFLVCLSVGCTHQGETGADESAQVLTRKKWKKQSLGLEPMVAAFLHTVRVFSWWHDGYCGNDNSVLSTQNLLGTKSVSIIRQIMLYVTVAMYSGEITDTFPDLAKKLIFSLLTKIPGYYHLNPGSHKNTRLLSPEPWKSQEHQVIITWTLVVTKTLGYYHLNTGSHKNTGLLSSEPWKSQEHQAVITWTLELSSEPWKSQEHQAIITWTLEVTRTLGYSHLNPGSHNNTWLLSCEPRKSQEHQAIITWTLEVTRTPGYYHLNCGIALVIQGPRCHGSS